MDELVFDDDTLAFSDVARATRAEEPRKNIRQETKLRSVGGPSSSKSRHEVGSSYNSKEVHYSLRDDDSNDNFEMEHIGDSSEGDERIDDDVLKD